MASWNGDDQHVPLCPPRWFYRQTKGEDHRFLDTPLLSPEAVGYETDVGCLGYVSSIHILPELEPGVSFHGGL